MLLDSTFISAPAPVLVLAAERMPWSAAVILASVFVVSGGLVAALSCKLAGGSIGRNRLMGLRLPSTLRSEEAWHAGQRAFAPFGLAAGLGCALLGAALLLRPSEGVAIVLSSLASIWLVTLPGIGAFMGDLAAKDA